MWNSWTLSHTTVDHVSVKRGRETPQPHGSPGEPSSAHRLLHKRADSRLFVGGQLLQREGGLRRRLLLFVAAPRPRRFGILLRALFAAGAGALVVFAPEAAGGAADGQALTQTAANGATFQDATGEAAGAPDITKVVVSNDDKGVLTFSVAIPSHPVLTEDMRIFIWFDFDDDPTTGLAQGLDHLLVVDVGSVGFGAAGLAFCGYPGPSCGVVEGWLGFGARVSLRFSYENGAAVFSFDAAKLARKEPFRIGGLERFRFWIVVESGVRFDPVTRRWDFTDWRRDVAPTDPPVGSGFPARDQFWIYESRPLLVRDFSANPATPRAGRPFALRLAAIRTDTGAALTSGAVSCSFTIAGKPLRSRSQGFVGQRAVCVSAIPANAKGRTFRGTISVQSGGAKLTRSVSGRVG